MSITDELMEYASTRISPNKGMLEAIADRIDAAHAGLERENAELSERVAVLDNESGNMQDGWVRLPLDADGVPIRVGDVMDSKVDYLFDGKPFTVRALVLCEDGWEAADGRFGNCYEPSSLHHHHAPTIEDVLWKFVCEFNRDDTELCDEEIIERFAAKLRLAGEDE